MAGGWHAHSAVEYTGRRQRMHRSRSGWILLMCAMLMGVLIFLFTSRSLHIRAFNRQIVASQAAYEQALIERHVLEAALASQDDLSAIEQAAREQLGWVMPGEERVIFIDQSGNSSSEGE